MMCADIYGDPPAFVVCNPDCMKAFIDAGFDLTTKGGKDRTILDPAAEFGLAMVEYLLGQAGTAGLINAQDSNGETPLHLAVDGKAICKLLDNGADSKLGDNNGRESSYRYMYYRKEE